MLFYSLGIVCEFYEHLSRALARLEESLQKTTTKKKWKMKSKVLDDDDEVGEKENANVLFL